MRFTLHASSEDVSKEEILDGAKSVETVRGAKFGRRSRVCRRTYGSRNDLNKIPENEVVDFRRIVCSPCAELMASRARAAPPGTNAKAAPDSSKEEIRKRRTGFWKVFKSKSGSDKRKTANHHLDASSLLSFV